MQTNDLFFNLTTFLQLLHFLCNKSGDFRDKYKDIIPNRISCKVAVYGDTFWGRELGEHDERFWSHRKALPALCLKLENWIKKTTETRPPRQQICRGEHCSPVLVARQTLRYPHNLLHFTNHVGERRNFCFTEMDVPFGGITHNCCIIDAKLFSGDIVVISYNNSVGQKISGCRISVSLRTEISPSPYIYSG